MRAVAKPAARPVPQIFPASCFAQAEHPGACSWPFLQKLTNLIFHCEHPVRILVDASQMLHTKAKGLYQAGCQQRIEVSPEMSGADPTLDQIDQPILLYLRHLCESATHRRRQGFNFSGKDC